MTYQVYHGMAEFAYADDASNAVGDWNQHQARGKSGHKDGRQSFASAFRHGFPPIGDTLHVAQMADMRHAHGALAVMLIDRRIGLAHVVATLGVLGLAFVIHLDILEEGTGWEVESAVSQAYLVCSPPD